MNSLDVAGCLPNAANLLLPSAGVPIMCLLARRCPHMVVSDENGRSDD